MAIEKHIAANILSASTRCVEDKVYGNMLLGLPGGRGNAVKEAIRVSVKRCRMSLSEEVMTDV